MCGKILCGIGPLVTILLNDFFVLSCGASFEVSEAVLNS